MHSSLLLYPASSLFFSPLSDGLTDCMDPDCCIQSPCQNSPLCRGSRDPLQVIQHSPLSQPHVRSFYDRIKMLVGRDSTHIIPGESPFNSRYGRKHKNAQESILDNKRYNAYITLDHNLREPDKTAQRSHSSTLQLFKIKGSKLQLMIAFSVL